MCSRRRIPKGVRDDGGSTGEGRQRRRCNRALTADAIRAEIASTARRACPCTWSLAVNPTTLRTSYLVFSNCIYIYLQPCLSTEWHIVPAEQQDCTAERERHQPVLHHRSRAICLETALWIEDGTLDTGACDDVYDGCCSSTRRALRQDVT